MEQIKPSRPGAYMFFLLGQNPAASPQLAEGGSITWSQDSPITWRRPYGIVLCEIGWGSKLLVFCSVCARSVST